MTAGRPIRVSFQLFVVAYAIIPNVVLNACLNVTFRLTSFVFRGALDRFIESGVSVTRYRQKNDTLVLNIIPNHTFSLIRQFEIILNHKNNTKRAFYDRQL